MPAVRSDEGQQYLEAVRPSTFGNVTLRAPIPTDGARELLLDLGLFEEAKIKSPQALRELEASAPALRELRDMGFEISAELASQFRIEAKLQHNRQQLAASVLGSNPEFRPVGANKYVLVASLPTP
jgi:hypothetical protein